MYVCQYDKSISTQRSNANTRLRRSVLCYLRPPALRKFSQKDLLLVLAISSSDVGMSFELNTLHRERGRQAHVKPTDLLSLQIVCKMMQYV